MRLKKGYWGTLGLYKWFRNFDLGTIFGTPKNHENQSAVDTKSKYGEKEIDFKLLKALYWHLLILTPFFHIHLCR